MWKKNFKHLKLPRAWICFPSLLVINTLFCKLKENEESLDKVKKWNLGDVGKRGKVKKKS